MLLIVGAAWCDVHAGSQAPAAVAEIERDIYDDPTSMLRDARARTAALSADARAERLRQLSRQVMAAITLERFDEMAAHAQARRVTLALHPLGERWELSIVDDGAGFDPEQRGNGYGLLGMEERANLVGGSLEVSSLPGEGTQVRLTIGAQPLRRGLAA